MSERKLYREYRSIPDEELEGLADRVAQILERRIYEWIGRKVALAILCMAGAFGTGAYIFVQYFKAKGVV